jgi:hypothetical protein
MSRKAKETKAVATVATVETKAVATVATVNELSFLQQLAQCGGSRNVAQWEILRKTGFCRNRQAVFYNAVNATAKGSKLTYKAKVNTHTNVLTLNVNQEEVKKQLTKTGKVVIGTAYIDRQEFQCWYGWKPMPAKGTSAYDVIADAVEDVTSDADLQVWFSTLCADFNVKPKDVLSTITSALENA